MLHDLEIKPKGNSTTQAYYMSRLLLVYAKEINEAQIKYDRYCILQEDNDPSHGTRSKDNVVTQFKEANWITSLVYPPQSPDLNSSEAC